MINSISPKLKRKLAITSPTQLLGIYNQWKKQQDQLIIMQFVSGPYLNSNIISHLDFDPSNKLNRETPKRHSSYLKDFNLEVSTKHRYLYGPKIFFWLQEECLK